MDTLTTPRRGTADIPGFEPFYERIATVRVAGATKIVIAFTAGLAFLLLRLIADGPRALVDWSILLAALITIATLALYFATHTFRQLLIDLRARAGDDAYADLLSRTELILADRRLVIAGSFFASANCLIGWALGVPGESILSQTTFLIGFAIAGFVCGIAAYSIVGVHMVFERLPHHLSRSNVLDFTSPDECGGTSFIGAALVVFGGVTLIVGVLISLYILNAPWTSKGVEPWWLNLLVGFWLAFPYLMSAAALMLPALGVHDALREYKREADAGLRRDLSVIEENLGGSDEAVRREEMLRSRRVELHRMRVWPFDLRAHVTYVALLAPNLGATLKSALNWYQ